MSQILCGYLWVHELEQWSRSAHRCMKNTHLCRYKCLRHKEELHIYVEDTYSDISVCFSCIDGPSGTIVQAHAPRDSRIIFDSSERWVDGSQSKSFDIVTMHEIGHALGLGHSNVRGAVMYYDYGDYGAVRRNLTPDDINEIKYLYNHHNHTNG
ncbi:Matrixin family protein [Striga hermonthica]|uniref:Matrixin family protein n=1 Tax=Striga hermonthica TaxID=68872 RepID=A0A9N7MWC9_STRHE|nr:Matrixin family protein [Striga hermonthica]